MRHSMIIAAVFASQLAAVLPAVAGECYEVIGCASTQYFPKSELKQLGCQNLWYVRNRIYKDAGYCFKTQTGINEMGNTGCHINNQAAVPLTAIEASNVAAVRSVEKSKGCNYGG